jgi:hypothetical protein
MSILTMLVFTFYNLHALHHSSAKRRIECLPHFQRKLFSVFLPHFCASLAGLTREYSEPCTRVEDRHPFNEYWSPETTKRPATTNPSSCVFTQSTFW